MHFDLELTFSSAEHKRTKGSVVYIVEFPALVFRSAAGHLVTEINTGRPLSGYSATTLAAKPLHGAKLRGARDCYLSKCAPMLGAALPFHHSSRSWQTRPPLQASVILVATEDLKTVVPHPLSSKMRIGRSYSNGGGCRLGWLTGSGKSNRSAKFIVEVAAQFGGDGASLAVKEEAAWGYIN